MNSSSAQIFYLIRHGETDWNVLRRLQGHSDIDLNAVGQQQAAALQDRMSQIHLTQIVSSDLIRARRTAELGLAASCSTPLIFTPALREVHLGLAEGQTRETLLQQFGSEFWDNWSSHRAPSLDIGFPEGETKRQMLNRLLPCLHQHLDQWPRGTLAFVSHGLALRTLVHFLDESLSETQFVANCGVLKMSRLNRKIRLVKYFDPTQTVE